MEEQQYKLLDGKAISEQSEAGDCGRSGPISVATRW